MAEYAKDIPSELRNKSATSSAEAHRGLASSSGSLGRAGPAAGSFRSTTRSNGADDAYNDFAQGSSSKEPVQQSGSRPRRVSSILASSWSGEDLAPRPNDGQAVLDLLASSSSLDDLNDSLDELKSRRRQEWQTQADNATPIDPASSDPLSRDAYPYLFNLLSLPEDQSVSTYLDMTSYSDDVYGLPLSLKQDLDRAKGIDGSTGDAQRKALGRLQMLREHLQAKAAEHPSDKVTFTPKDWDRIWQMRLS